MRLAVLAILVALAAPAQARMPVASPPLTLAPLGWGMSLTEATTVLETAKLSPRREVVRRYKRMTKTQTRVEHTDEPWIWWTPPGSPRFAWRGWAHYAWDAAAQDYRIDRMGQGAEALTVAAFRDELAALRDRYGEPGTKRATAWTWRQGGTTLTADWFIDEKRDRVALGVTIRRE